jgi:hypothetical protein
MVKPRKGKLVRVAPPPDQPIRAHIEAVVTIVTPEWVEVEVRQESWRFRAGTLLLLRRAALLEVDRQLIAPDGAVVRVYPPETRNPRHAAEALGRLLRDARAGIEDHT